MGAGIIKYEVPSPVRANNGGLRELSKKDNYKYTDACIIQHQRRAGKSEEGRKGDTFGSMEMSPAAAT